jgi:uncharacterized tellurite resistance protein B-like protein
MSILKKFLGLPAAEDESSAATDTVRKIAARLEQLDPARARYVAAFAYILGRVAHADLDISADESGRMEELVVRHGELPADQALLVVEIAKSQNRLFGGTENYLVTREFAEIASLEQKLELLDCLFAVSAADDSISVAEEEQVRRVATELGLTHRQYVEARARYSAHRTVMREYHDRAAPTDEGG